MSEVQFQPGDVLKEGRYELVRLLGQGGFGATWEAIDRERREQVAIKRLELRRAADWKAFELFEREVAVLQSISCEQVPAYIDYFQDHAGAFCLVQQLAPGQTIEHWVRERGWRPSDEELSDWLLAMLDALEVLHAYRPAIIHRDIKPQNVLRDEWGKVSVVDFGSVKSSSMTADEQRIGGSTMVGTFGYMAPEQLRGVASPATDLYGLAMTALFIMTHREPGELPTRRLKIDLEQVFGEDWTEQPLLGWLDGMIEPAEEDRFASAEQARHALLKALRDDPLTRTPVPPVKPSTPGEETQDDEEDEPVPEAILERLHPDDPELTEGLEVSSPGCSMLSLLGAAMVLALVLFMPYHIGAVVGLMLAIPFVTVMLAVSVAPDRLMADPRSHLATLRGDILGFATGWLLSTVVMTMYAVDLAPVWTVVVFALYALSALLMGAMYASTWRAMSRQRAIEEQFHVQLPIVPKDQDRDVRLEVRAYEPGRMLHLRETTTFTAPTWLWIGGTALGVGLALQQLGVSPPYDVMSAWCGILFTVCSLIAVWLGFTHVSRRAFLKIDTSARTIEGRPHQARTHAYHMDQIKRWEVCTRQSEGNWLVVVRLHVAHAAGVAPGDTREVEVFRASERSEVLAAAQVVVLQRLMDEMFGTGGQQSDVVFDFAQAEALRVQQQPVRVEREV